MDAKILLGKILQRFADKKSAKVDGYNSFGYLRETNNAIYVTREAGKDTRVSFDKLIVGIGAYQADSSLYNEGPTALRDFGITHVTSPVWALLHLLPVQAYN